jgi:hypothetical protein
VRDTRFRQPAATFLPYKLIQYYLDLQEQHRGCRAGTSRTVAGKLGMSTSTTEITVPTATHVEVTDVALTVELVDGRSVSVPLLWYPRLAHATSDERGVGASSAGARGSTGPTWMRTSASPTSSPASPRARASVRSSAGWRFAAAPHRHVALIAATVLCSRGCHPGVGHARTHFNFAPDGTQGRILTSMLRLKAFPEERSPARPSANTFFSADSGVFDVSSFPMRKPLGSTRTKTYSMACREAADPRQRVQRNSDSFHCNAT